MVTFSGLLNALDGVTSTEERIIFMTTNHIDRLDPALIRPGRVDMRLLIDDVTPHQVKRLFLRFYEGEDTLAQAFVDALTDSTTGKMKRVSAAQIQGHFVLHRSSARAAVDTAQALGLNDDTANKES
jgi:chaperone BCS1